ncbi:MAG TPA: hypothetical protein VLB79_06320 [Solirubrobacterales bacterium]|nr:hypothetical protein [Solirubrobacterales bacterium]
MQLVADPAAPLIISTAAFASLPSRSTSLASPSSFAGTSPSDLISPPSPIAQKAARP